ncbi:MAG TPA: C4-type zinc ribbon domain-containing protein, partial [Tissierellaceae bacterium]
KNLSENEVNNETLNQKNITEIKILKVNIENLSKKIEEEKTLLDKRILDDYLKIKKRKKKAVALAEDSTCRGCNMKLSSGMWDEIKHSEEPILCDSCGRILYYNEKENN